MEIEIALKRLSALAQQSRLEVFRRLVQAGAEGLAAGDLARAVDIPANTLSAQLVILVNAGLARSRREGRSIIYSADYDGMGALLVFLMEDCCQNRAEVCGPLAAAVTRPSCNPV
ncbi:MAG: metalloregulator ArsR/SmtB family transcription factor [Phenylobacterium sp.]|uniref:ArsR/SmtB family transcription factor n=1 Tax=Phenylobacterium sp. TaxID=1871053 RepID=UPI002723C644|nr:metalloregulator ArsR/SmtB family transcription factor [Phenylobacterium sp.]MDO8901158.1 metalloregulator ArsR/SmtB family transcription factor [Phenylobacterium sp.]MDP2214356.1 metalloregulator ArsR/SmtB family transcription factor [Phenylobacterium sp.]